MVVTLKGLVWIGAGLAGLSLARILHEHSISFEIYDALPATHTQGYSITMRSWSYDQLLEEIDRDVGHLKASTATDAACGGGGLVDRRIYDAHTGEQLFDVGGAPLPAYRANRNALRTYLLQGIDPARVHNEMKLVNVESADEGTVAATFADGQVVKGKFLVAADGVHSTVRKTKIPQVEPKVLPVKVYSGQLQLDKGEYEAILLPVLGESNALLAVVSGNSVFGLTNTLMSHSSVDISWVYSRKPSGAEVNGGAGDAIVIPVADTSRMAAEIGTIEPPLAEPYKDLISPEKLSRARLYHWQMRSVRVPLDELARIAESEKIAFIGDAVHAMPIFAGEGGNHAMLDGVELGRAIAGSEGDVQATVKGFYEKMYPNWQEGIARSEMSLDLLHKPLEEWKKMGLGR